MPDPPIILEKIDKCLANRSNYSGTKSEDIIIMENAFVVCFQPCSLSHNGGRFGFWGPENTEYFYSCSDKLRLTLRI